MFKKKVKKEEAPAKTADDLAVEAQGDEIVKIVDSTKIGIQMKRRETIATAIAQGLAASPNHSAAQQADYERLAKEAVIAADALIAALDHTKGA